MRLMTDHGLNLPWSCDRKELKEHGEGGRFIGASPKGKRVMILDDVLTAGTAARHCASQLRAAGASVAGLLVGLDRRQADNELEQQLQAPIQSLATLNDLLAYLRNSPAHHQQYQQLEQSLQPLAQD